MAIYSDKQLKDIKREACMTGNDEQALKNRSMAVARLGYALCSDELTSDKRWELTQTLVAQCFGKEPDSGIRFEMADVIGTVAASGCLELEQGKTLILQMAHYLDQKVETNSFVEQRLAGWLGTINRLGLEEIYSDNTVFMKSDAKVIPLNSFAFAYGQQN